MIANDETPDVAAEYDLCVCHKPCYADTGVICPACQEAFDAAAHQAWEDERELADLYYSFDTNEF